MFHDRNCTMPAARDPHTYLAQFNWTDAEHPAWNAKFSEQLRCAQIDEDLFAARTVSAVLITIVFLGTALGALAVGLAMLIPS
jgi:hypothetical protein